MFGRTAVTSLDGSASTSPLLLAIANDGGMDASTEADHAADTTDVAHAFWRRGQRSDDCPGTRRRAQYDPGLSGSSESGRAELAAAGRAQRRSAGGTALRAGRLQARTAPARRAGLGRVGARDEAAWRQPHGALGRTPREPSRRVRLQ